MSRIILLAKALINGVIYRAGDDISDVATAGEIGSLRAGGFVSRGPVDVVEMNPGEVHELPSGWSIAQEPPVEPIPAPGVDWRDVHVSTFHPDNALEGADATLTLDADVVALLIKGNLETLGKLSDHLSNHGHFRGIHGIGKATSPKVEAALKAFLAGLQ